MKKKNLLKGLLAAGVAVAGVVTTGATVVTLTSCTAEEAPEAKVLITFMEGEKKLSEAEMVNGVVTTPVAAEGYKYETWYSDAECTKAVDLASLTEATTVYGKQTMTYAKFQSTAKGESVAIEGYIGARQTYYKGAVLYIYGAKGEGYLGYQIPMTEEEYNTKYTVGTYVRLEGEMTEYAGLKEVAATDAVLTVVTGKPAFAPEAVDVSGKLASLDDTMMNYFTAKLTLKAYEGEKDKTAASGAYGWGSKGEGDDLYFTLTDGTNDLDCCIEKYTEGSDAVKEALKTANVGDEITVTGYMYWWNGANPHIMSLSVKPLEGINAYYHDGSSVTIKPIVDGGFGLIPEDVVLENEYKTFEGWYTDPECTTPYDGSVVTGSIHLYAKWTALTEEVTYNFDYAKAQGICGGSGSGYKQNVEGGSLTVGKFTVENGVYYENNNTVNNQQKAITFKLAGKGKLSFDMKGASSTGMTMSLYKDGELLKVWDSVSSGTTVTVTPIELEAGEYTLDSVGSARISNLKLIDTVEKAPVTELKLSPAVTDVLVGRDLDVSGLQASLVYGNGRTEAVNVTDVDITAVDKTKSGTYTVTVKYTLEGESFGSQNGQVMTSTYNVNYYAVDSITAYDYVLTGKRVTENLQKVFIKDSTFNSTNLAVHATGKCGDKTMDFVLADTEYSVTAADTASVGEKEVAVACTIAGNEKTTSYKVNVLEATQNLTEVTVDASATATSATTFKSINDALAYFKLCNVADETVKTIKLAPGTYTEKVYITMPNVKIIGTATGEGSNEKAVITYNMMNGIMDPSGAMAHSTDGAATFTVAAGADNFYAENIKIMNYYNTHALYEESKKITSDTQATACLVRADKVMFKNVFFSGYHDTLYADLGRQYYENCHIEGRTDYIFGDTAVAVFKGCTIKSIGAGLDQNNGGYVVATKGGSKAGNQTYGYIFDGCKFTADENTREGSVSLARGWADGMTMMVMNSDLSAHFSKEYYGEKTVYAEGAEYTKEMNDRYTKMNAAPNAKQLFEYNNTGAGAMTAEELAAVITEATETDPAVTRGSMTATYATEAFAADCQDYFKVFAAVNGNVKYSDNWNPVVAKAADITVKNADGTDNVVLTDYYYTGVKMTEDELEVLASKIVVPADKQIKVIATDAAGTTAWDGTVAEATTLYVILEEKAATVTYSYAYGTTPASDWVEDTTQGTITDAKDATKKGIKLVPDTYLTLNTVAGNKVSLVLTGWTTGSSKASAFLDIKLYAADGTVVGSATGTSGVDKTVANWTVNGENEIVIETAEGKTFTSIKITSNTAGKSVTVYTAEVTVFQA